jgi:hypothetical protein
MVTNLLTRRGTRKVLATALRHELERNWIRARALSGCGSLARHAAPGSDERGRDDAL